MPTLKDIIVDYENRLDRSNVHAIEAQLSQSLGNELEDAKREAYLAIVEMCDYLNAWARDPGFLKNQRLQTDFLQKVQNELNSIHNSIERNATLQPFAYLVAYAQGFVFRARGKHQEAFAEFEKSAQLNKGFYRADAQKAAQRIYLDDLHGAKRLIQEAISKTPKDSPAYANEKWTASRIKFFLGDYKGAIELLDESIKLNSTLWYTFAYKCSACFLSGLHSEAKELLAVLDERFKIKTLQDIMDREKLNPTAHSKSVEEGRRRLHDGLLKAGLKPD